MKKSAGNQREIGGESAAKIGGDGADNTLYSARRPAPAARARPATAMNEPTRQLDTRGLNCPLPILRAKKTLNQMAAGEVLAIVATDPGAVKDFEAFAAQTGNELLESSEADGEFHFKVRKV